MVFSGRKGHIRGFTAIEVIFILLVIGILAITITPNWTATSMGLQFEALRVLQDIRYTQALSVTSGQRYRWVRTSSTTYQVLNEAGTAILLPSGVTTLTLSGDVILGTLTNLPNNLIAFDSQGTPYTTSSYPGTALVATASIPLVSGSQIQTIQISPETGYGMRS